MSNTDDLDGPVGSITAAELKTYLTERREEVRSGIPILQDRIGAHAWPDQQGRSAGLDETSRRGSVTTPGRYRWRARWKVRRPSREKILSYSAGGAFLWVLLGIFTIMITNPNAKTVPGSTWTAYLVGIAVLVSPLALALVLTLLLGTLKVMVWCRHHAPLYREWEPLPDLREEYPVGSSPCRHESNIVRGKE